VNEDVHVVRDDTSSRGLRRLHLLRARGQINTEEAILRWVGEHGEVEASLEYEDEVGMRHLRLYWRVKEGEHG